jgi:hypothetical protein
MRACAGLCSFVAVEPKERGIPFWLRYVLIPNWTDRVGDIEMLIAFAKAQPTMLVSGCGFDGVCLVWYTVYAVCACVHVLGGAPPT